MTKTVPIGFSICVMLAMTASGYAQNGVVGSADFLVWQKRYGSGKARKAPTPYNNIKSTSEGQQKANKIRTVPVWGARAKSR